MYLEFFRVSIFITNFEKYVPQKSFTHPHSNYAFKSIIACLSSPLCTVFIKSLCLLLQGGPASDHPANIRTIKRKARDFIVREKITPLKKEIYNIMQFNISLNSKFKLIEIGNRNGSETEHRLILALSVLNQEKDGQL